jgi:hypothetical protein
VSVTSCRSPVVRGNHRRSVLIEEMVDWSRLGTTGTSPPPTLACASAALLCSRAEPSALRVGAPLTRVASSL